MNMTPAAATPFGDQTDFLSFLGDNEMAHITFATALGRNGALVHSVLPVGNPYESPAWLADHWQRHIDECSTLGIPVPDLGSVDLTDERQYRDWMELHGNLHRAMNSALGINT